MKLLGASQSEEKLYVDDVFSTYLYTGNGGTQTINNGIDLAGEGGLVWFKSRTETRTHSLFDTTRGALKGLHLNDPYATSGQFEIAGSLTSFGPSGFSVGSSYWCNKAGHNYASWTFRRAPKFFDIVTYTGNGVAGRQIPHNLGVAPGMVIVKATNKTSEWVVYHRSLGAAQYLQLHNTATAQTSSIAWGNTEPTNAVFTVDPGFTNISGWEYVAYLFAHDTSADGVIQCGRFTTDGSGNATVNLGWEPQFLLVKTTSSAQNWRMFDSMRGMPVGSADAQLIPNSAEAESSSNFVEPDSTGFKFTGSISTTYIYLAIRRPNKPPKTGAEVYNGVLRPNWTLNGEYDLGLDGFDFVGGFASRPVGGYSYSILDRLRGQTQDLKTASTAAETAVGMKFVNQAAISPTDGTWGPTKGTAILHALRRAPGFMDVVCDTGTGSAHPVSHQLGVAPELLIRKARNNTQAWGVLYTGSGGLQGRLNETSSLSAPSAAVWGSGGVYVAPTATAFTVGTDNETNANTWTYTTYLFATLPGISKVGSYTGNGSSQTINCGFSAGARFVLIKRTDSTGDWYVWDSVRGIVAANDPHLSLNTTAVEVTTDDSVDPDSSGFIVNQNTATNINVNTASYIFLAIA